MVEILALLARPEWMALFIGIVSAVAIACFYPILMNVLELAPYAYINAKIRAIEAGLLKKEKLDDIITSNNVIEGVGMLEQTDYGRYVNKLSEPFDSGKVGKVLTEHYVDVYRRTTEVVPDDMQEVFKKLSKIWDAHNIKACLRAVKENIEPEEREQYMVKLGTLKESTLKALIESKSMDEVISELESTEYGKRLSNELSELRKEYNLLPFEVALDKDVFKQAYTAVASPRDVNMNVIKILLGTRIDLMNLKTIIRGKVKKVDSRILEEFMIQINYHLKGEKLKNLVKIEGIPEMASHLENTPYQAPLGETLANYKEGDSLLEIEKKMADYYVKVARGLSISYPLGVGPALGLLTSKEHEVKKLKAIMVGTEENLGVDEIRRLAL